jgi:hypothetical protein
MFHNLVDDFEVLLQCLSKVGALSLKLLEFKAQRFVTRHLDVGSSIHISHVCVYLGVGGISKVLETAEEVVLLMRRFDIIMTLRLRRLLPF